MKTLILILILILLYISDGSGLPSQSPDFDLEEKSIYLPLRVMTFNIWKGGTQVDNGLYKVANHIKIVNPDIVALQVSMTFNFIKVIIVNSI